MKQLHIISCVEDKERFLWESTVQLQNAKKYNLSEKFRIIIFLPAFKQSFSEKWKELEALFPETKFFYYTDRKGKVTDLIVNYDYIPIHRLCSLEKHFKDYPELEKDTILYMDSDVIFTKDPNLLPSILDDDTNYLSDVHTYLNEKYFSGKIKDVIPEKREEYEKIDVVSKIASFAKIDKDTLKRNNNSTGGAQYILKNMSSKFFSECIDICLLFRIYLQTINQQFFPGTTPLERENKGFQSWTADMAAIQWNLWRHNLPTQTPKWMDFAWATDKIERLESTFFLHNAGITEDGKIRITDSLHSVKDADGNPIIIEAPAFFKGDFVNKSPFDNMESVEESVFHPDTRNYCISIYAKEVLNTYNSLIKNKNKEHAKA